MIHYQCISHQQQSFFWYTGAWIKKNKKSQLSTTDCRTMITIGAYNLCYKNGFPAATRNQKTFFFFFFQVNALTLVLEISFSSTFSHQFGLGQFSLANSYQPFSICCPCCVTGLQNTLWGKHCLPSSLMVLWLMGEEQSNAFPPRIHRAWPILLS